MSQTTAVLVRMPDEEKQMLEEIASHVLRSNNSSIRMLIREKHAELKKQGALIIKQPGTRQKKTAQDNRLPALS